MWKDLDLEQMAEEENRGHPSCSPEEVEQIVVMVRLEQYNRGLPCGARALRRRLDEFYHLKPLPSVTAIGRILARNGLTYARTGWYEGDVPEWLPASAKRWQPAAFTESRRAQPWPS